MRPEKQLIEKEYTAHIRDRSGVAIAEYSGLNSESFVKLRREVLAVDADCLVVKNRVFRLTLKETGLELLDPFCEGQNAVLVTDNELPQLLKVIIRHESEEGSPRLKAAVWDGTFYDAKKLKILAELPSREEILSRVLSGMQSPISGLVGVMHGLVSGLARAVKAIRDQRSQ